MSETMKNEPKLISSRNHKTKGRIKTIGFIIIQVLVSIVSSLFGFAGDQIDISYPHFDRRIVNMGKTLFLGTQVANLGLTAAIIFGDIKKSKYERKVRIFIYIGSILLSVIGFVCIRLLKAPNFSVTSSGPFCNDCYYGVFTKKTRNR